MTSQDPSHPDVPVDLNNHQLDSFLGRAFEQKPLLTGLYESLRDCLFPPSLPPLELTSTPVLVPDRMAVQTNPWAFGTAAIVNGAILALILGLGLKAAINPPSRTASHSHVDLGDLIAPFKLRASQGGSGGGSDDLVDPIQGRLPKFEKTPLAPLQVPVLEHPKLAIDSALAVDTDIKLPDNPNMPVVGVHSSPNVTLLPGGPGTHGGIGIGTNGGLGSDKGIGFGPGPEGIYTPGGDVSAPIPILTPEAEFSDEARRAKYQGVCMISVIIDAHGNPQNPRILHSLGMGLDEKALEAVRKYRFKPAMRQGRPVPVRIAVAVDFRLY
jgi:periplasmic protein TonB